MVEEDIDDEETTKKTPKKKYYPFGTPSHMSHPFSQFAHLTNDNRAYALELATATDIKPDVIQEKSRRIRRVPKPSDDEENPADDIPDAEGLEPCTKIPCQTVLRGLHDAQLQNQIERLEIEDEYERALEELKYTEQDIFAAEKSLETLTEIGNQLEHHYNHLMSKVESLEKKKDNLQNERSDMNSKVMVSETEKQKCSRNLEKAQKALADAMWRKKKREQKQDAEAGLILAPSEISESNIKQVNPTLIEQADQIYHTNYNRLAEKHVRDLIENPVNVKTLPLFLQEKMFFEKKKFDKYAWSHYKGLAERSFKSWAADMEGSTATSKISMRAPPLGVVGSVFPAITAAEGELEGDALIHSTVSAVVSERVSSALQNNPKLDESMRGNLISALRRSQSHKRGMGKSASPKRRRNIESKLKTNRMTVSQSTTSLSHQSSRVNSAKEKQVRLSPLTNLGPLSPAGRSHSPSLLNIGEGGFSEYHTDGLGLNTSRISVIGSPSEKGKHKLNGVFYKEQDRAKFARNKKIGKVRVLEVENDDDGASTESDAPGTKVSRSSTKVSNISYGSSNNMRLSRASSFAGNNDNSSVGSKAADPFPHFTAYGKMKYQRTYASAEGLLPLKSRALTVHHPKMETFNDSIVLDY